MKAILAALLYGLLPALAAVATVLGAAVMMEAYF